MSELARFARAEGARVEVVFDGAPDEHFPDGSYFMGVRVFYAARGSDADSKIKGMVDAARERRTLVVVTSDRELAAYVRASGVRVASSGEFRRRLDASGGAGEAGASRKESHQMSHEELLKEMRYFGVAPEDDEEP